MEHENNPNFLREPSQEVLAHNVESYLRALRNGAYGSLCEPAEIIKGSRVPFSRDITEISQHLENRWMKEDDVSKSTVFNLLRQDAFAVALRVYVYSGVKINPALVFMTTDYLGLDDDWVRKIIRPSKDLIMDSSIRYRQRPLMRQRGRRALMKLELTPLCPRWLQSYVNSWR